MNKTHKALAGCVILNSKSEVLLIYRNTPRLTQWELPGGKVEPGEKLEEAAKREVFEEIGCKVEIRQRLGSTIFTDNGIDWHYTWFHAAIREGKPEPQEKIHDGWAYFNLNSEELDHSTLSINILNLIKAIKNREVRL